MPANSARAAVEAHLDRLRRLAACVTNRPLHATGYRVSDEPNSVAFIPFGQPAPVKSLRTGRRLSLFVHVEYEALQRVDARRSFDVRTSGYRYHLIEPQGRELLAFHWHPAGVSDVRFPHLHLSTRIPSFEVQPHTEPVALSGMHIPTGFVSFADVVRLLVVEFGIEPRRANWEEIVWSELDDEHTILT